MKARNKQDKIIKDYFLLRMDMMEKIISQEIKKYEGTLSPFGKRYKAIQRISAAHRAATHKTIKELKKTLYAD